MNSCCVIKKDSSYSLTTTVNRFNIRLLNSRKQSKTTM